MLKELNHYENLGTPKYFHELFTKLREGSQEWSVTHVNEHFRNRIIDDRFVFDGCIALAENIGAISISPAGQVILHPVIESYLRTEEHLSNKLLNMLLTALKSDDVFYEIFCSENLSYDIIYRSIQIDNNAFSFRYANFRDLLLSFTFIQTHPNSQIKKYIINSRFKKLFDTEILPTIKKRKVGIEELERLLEQKQIHGLEAEKYVLEYEKSRLSGHSSIDNVEIISTYDTGAGYDIVSYEDVSSIEHNQFIEVKSYTGSLTFHWSRNEIEIARILKDKYYLYLVNRDSLKDETYTPYIIKNPYAMIIENDKDWEKQVEGYFITRHKD